MPRRIASSRRAGSDFLVLGRAPVAVMTLEPQHEISGERGPPGLVRRAQPLAGVAVEVLVDEDAIAELGLVLEEVDFAVDGAAAVAAALEDAHEPLRDLLGALAQGAGSVAAHRRDRQDVAEAVLEPQQ